MSISVIKEYLVSIGFDVNGKSVETTKKTISAFDKEIKSLLKSLAAGFALLGAALTGMAASMGFAGRKLGNITYGVDKFALSMYTTRKNARALQAAMNAMGIDSIEELKFINLMPEQRQQFLDLKKLAEELTPDQETQQGLRELRKLGFEFQKIQIQLASIGLKILGALGNLLSTPLFKKGVVLLDLIVNLVGYIANKMASFLNKFPTGSAIGGLLGGVTAGAAGGYIGTAAGAALGAPLGPLGSMALGAAGGTIGSGIGTAIGASSGVIAGGLVEKHKKEIKNAAAGLGGHTLKAGVRLTDDIKAALRELDITFGKRYTVTSGLASRSGRSWHTKGLAADLVPEDQSAKGYADLVQAALSTGQIKKLNLELKGAKYANTVKELKKRGVDTSKIQHMITKDFTGEHIHATVRPVQISVQVNGSSQAKKMIETSLNTATLQGRFA